MTDNHAANQQKRRILFLGITLLAFLIATLVLLPIGRSASANSDRPSASSPSVELAKSTAPITIDYPQNGSIFPPGITPPTFLWRDSAATSWHITVSFGNKSPSVNAISAGTRMHLGPIDPDCVSDTNEPPKLTPQQAASWAWTPDPSTWAAIQLHSAAQPATLTITGYRNGKIVSPDAHIAFTTSRDPVGAPIFYRDVPLMPQRRPGRYRSAAFAVQRST